MEGLVSEPIDRLNVEQLAQVQVIYEDSFSSDLRVPFGELARQGNTDRTFVALDGTQAVGFAALRLLGSVQWSFLRYFAIATSRRSQGIGRRFWHLVNGSLRMEDWPARIVFEVEDPDDANDAAERSARQRRIDFWTVCGARLLPAPGYVLPDYTGTGSTHPMLLMASSSEGSPALHGDQFRSVIRAIFTDRYGLSASDPLVVRALDRG